MTAGKSVALITVLVGVLALGVWMVPRVWDTDARPAKTPAARVASPSTPETASARSLPRREAAAPAASALRATAPELHDRLKPVLNRGTKMTMAADGFGSAEQFATVAHAAHNTGVPFMVLKHRVLEEGKTLAAAIRESKPTLNAAAEVRRARAAAREDISAIMS